MLYVVTIVYPKQPHGYGSRRPIYERVAVDAADADAAKARALEVATWRGIGEPARITTECREYIGLGSGQTDG